MNPRQLAISGLGPRFRTYCEGYSTEPNTAQVAGIDLVIHPRVFRAEGASTTATLIEALGSPTGMRVLDMGCGTGVVGVLAALRGAASVVLADHDVDAVDNARANVARHGLEDRCTVVQTDLFAALAGQRFDLIVFNIPFLYADASADEIDLPVPEHLAQAIPPASAFVDVGYQMIREFLRQGRDQLEPGGRIRCTFASFANQERFDEILAELELERRTIVSRPEPEYGLEYLAFEITPRT